VELLLPSNDVLPNLPDGGPAIALLNRHDGRSVHRSLLLDAGGALQLPN